ncbi:MAG: LLM class flavin-dependent oxidoreductase [Chloroflexi bacterium]|nr:LLM class flavin-dependent oxidoreductase [Chloroflexota bacterium]
MSVQFYLRIPPCAPADRIASFVRECEDAGFAGVGILDSPILLRELFVTMTAAALATSRIRLATAVTNPATRHASVLASAAKAVEELAPGRVEIWIGRGMTATGTIGQSPAPLKDVRESIIALQKLLAGEPVEFNGVTSRLRHGGGGHIPVYMAATGPKALTLAGAVADGVLVEVGIHPRVIAEVRRYIAEGARQAGRDPSKVKLIASAATIIENDLRSAQERARLLAVHWLVETQFVPWLGVAGVKTDSVDPPRELWELYPDVGHAVDQERARQLCSFLPQEMLAQICDTLGFIGTPEHCAERVREASANGLDGLFLKGESTYELPYQEMAAFRDIVFPTLAAP